MKIELLTDLIKDDRGNYYVAVHKDDRQLTLVNAAVERSYRLLLEFTDEFKRKYAEYEHHFIGKIVLDDVRHDIVFALKDDNHGCMFELQSVQAYYQVTFIDMIEFYRHPHAAQG